MDSRMPFLQWEVDMPLLTNRFFPYDVTKVIAGAAALFGALMFLIVGAARAAFMLKFVGACLGVVLLLFLLVALVVFGNIYRIRYLLTPLGIYCEGADRRGNAAGRIAVVAGALTGNPGLLGSGLIAAARQSGLVEWNRVWRIKSYAHAGTITIMNRRRVIARIFCPRELYAEALQWVQEYAHDVASHEFR